MDCSLPGSSVHGIFQARILECTFPPDSALIPIITEDLSGGVPCSLQGATSQGKFLYSCCAASEGTAAHSIGLLLRNGGQLK